MAKRVILGRPPQNPVELEAALGLARGKVLSMSSDAARGEIIVDFDNSVKLPDATLTAKLEQALNRKVV